MPGRITKSKQFVPSAYKPRNCRPRRARPYQIVLHWTGGLGSHKDVYDTLTKRGLSTHYYIDPIGDIWQYADPESITCYHAGEKTNDRSIGVEIASLGTDVARAHGCSIVDEGWVRYCDFTTTQYGSIIYLVDRLCTEYAMQRKVLRPIVKRALTPDQTICFSGVMGHYQISERKADPGPRILQAICGFFGDTGE